MGKRSDYVPRARDKYYTPLEAVRPLANLIKGTKGFFCEPCAGNGQLVNYIEGLLPDFQCILALDIEPEAPWILQADAHTLTSELAANCDVILTNPPFTWQVLQPLMDRFISICPTILLLPADYMHNQRMKPYMQQCVGVKSIGRVKWIEGSKATGVDNYAWYYFDKNKPMDEPTSFIARD